MSGEPVVSLIVPGDPRGKGRPRFRIVQPRGKPQFVTVYTDSMTLEWEKAIAQAGASAWRRPPLETALTVFAEAFLPIPVSWSQRKQAQAIAGDLVPTGKPDGDNIQKCVGDALNKIVWEDDSQIVMWQCLKLYSDFPRLRVSVWEWFDVPAVDVEPELKLDA